MHFFQVLLALPALVSAADIRLRYEAKCTGGYLVCSNVAENRCCGGIENLRGYKSVGFVNMPRNSAVYAFQRTRDGNNCGSQAASGNTGGGDNACLNFPGGSGQFSGGLWTRGKKSTRVAPEVVECTGTVMADALVLDGGVKFDITRMEDGMINELYEMLVNGTESASVPEAFKAFMVAE